MAEEIAEKKIYVYGTDDGRRFITTAHDELGAVSRILEKFPKNRSKDGALSGLFRIATASLEGVIEERLTTVITVM